MRILLATFWQYPSGGGIDQYITELKAGLEQEGHEVDVFGKMPDHSGYYLVEANLTIPKKEIKKLVQAKVNKYYKRMLPKADSWVRWVEVEKYCYEAAALTIEANRYDVIHTQDILSSRAFSRIRSSSQAHIATLHGSWSAETKLAQADTDIATDEVRWMQIKKYLGLCEYLGVAHNDLTIVPTRWLKDVMSVRFKFPSNMFRVMSYGIDLERFTARSEAPLDTITSKPEGKKVLLCCARMTAVKGHIHLIHALTELKQRRDDWVCWLAGGGELEARLKSMVAEAGLQERVIFLGKRRDVPALLKQADIFVLPSIWDNHPFALMEALISGKAAIVSNAGGIPEMVEHMQTALLFEAANPFELCRCLDYALDRPALCATLGENGKERAAREWSLRRMTAATMDLYRQLLTEDQKGKAELSSLRKHKKKTDSDKNIPVSANDFNKLFLSPRSTKGIYVDPALWSKIAEHAPKHYRIPDREIIGAMKPYWEEQEPAQVDEADESAADLIM